MPRGTLERFIEDHEAARVEVRKIETLEDDPIDAMKRIKKIQEGVNSYLGQGATFRSLFMTNYNREILYALDTAIEKLNRLETVPYKVREFWRSEIARFRDPESRRSYLDRFANEHIGGEAGIERLEAWIDRALRIGEPEFMRTWRERYVSIRQTFQFFGGE